MIIPGSHSLITCSGYVQKDVVEASEHVGGKALRFNRTLGLTGKGYGWDNPGARISFRTDAKRLGAVLCYSANHGAVGALNSRGLYFIDGKHNPEWCFERPGVGEAPVRTDVRVSLMNAEQAEFRDYEIVLPYGDSVEFIGIDVEPGARLAPYEHTRSTRYVAYGDSVTQGFTASGVDKTYAFLLAEKFGWTLINCGFGGRSSNADDGRLIASLRPDVTTVLMGVNDWQCGVSVERFSSNISETLDGVRRECPDAIVYLITPLAVVPTWKPPQAIRPLEDYRLAIRRIADRRDDRLLRLVEGPSLIDCDKRYFDKIAVHPNDGGFAMMGNRLGEFIRKDFPHNSMA